MTVLVLVRWLDQVRPYQLAVVILNHHVLYKILDPASVHGCLLLSLHVLEHFVLNSTDLHRALLW